MSGRTLFAAGVVALLALTPHELVGPAPAQSPDDPPLPEPINGTPVPIEPAQLRETWGATAIARPLFAVARRPPEITRADPLLGGNLQTPRLTGTIVSAAVRVALIVNAGQDLPSRIEQGEQVGLYTVLSIEAGQVTMDGPDGAIILRLSGNRAKREIEAAALQAKSPRPKRRGLPNEF